MAEKGYVEVDEEAHFQAREFEVREKLCLVDRFEVLDSLDLDHHQAVDDQVDAVVAFQRMPL